METIAAEKAASEAKTREQREARLATELVRLADRPSRQIAEAMVGKKDV